MATYTQDELVDEAIRKLMVVGAGQSPDAEDQELVDGKVPALIDQLSADGFCTVSDPDAIPGEWFDCIASLLANLCSPDFGKAYSPQVKEFYEKQLIRMNAVGPTRQRLEAEYF